MEDPLCPRCKVDPRHRYPPSGILQGYCRSCRKAIDREQRGPRKTYDWKGTRLGKVYSIYRSGSTKRELIWDISKDEFRQLATKECYYCGSLPRNGFLEYGTPIVYNGLDRVDNSRGYVLDNVVTCCSTCNYMKSDKTKEAFIKHCAKILAYTLA